MTELLLAERITLARQLRMLSKTDFAKSIDVTLRTATNYERSGAPLNKLTMIASTLNFPEKFFLGELLPELDRHSVEFRSYRGTPAKERKASLAHAKLGIGLVTWIKSKFSLPSLGIPSFNGMDPQMAANVVRELWGLGSKPLPNLVQLCESKGIHVLGLPKSIASIDALSFWYEGSAFILLARNKTPERTRFNLAHELGHLVLHENHYGFSEPDYESEADSFATEFLFPRVAQYEYCVKNPDLKQIMTYKGAFGLSAFATVHALHRSGLLTDWAYRKMCVELSRQGVKSAEPESRMSYEKSRVFSVVLDSLVGRKTGFRTIADAMSFPLSSVHSLMMADLNTVEGNCEQGLVSLPITTTIETSSSITGLHVVK